MSKGQVIVITALIIVIVLVLIRIESSHLMLREQRTETGIFSRFDNLKNELLKSGELGFNNYTILHDFSKLISDEEDVELFYSVSKFVGSDEKLNITVVNFLDEPINNISITQNLTNETKTISSLGKEETGWVDFTYTPSETPVDVLINISYTGNMTNNVVTNSYATKAGESTYITIFYDFSMRYGDSVLNDKFLINKAFVYTWHEAEIDYNEYGNWREQTNNPASNKTCLRQQTGGTDEWASWGFDVVTEDTYFFWFRGRYDTDYCENVRLLWDENQIGLEQDWSLGSGGYYWSSFGSRYLSIGSGTLKIINKDSVGDHPIWADNILVTNDPFYVPENKGVQGSDDEIIG